MTMRDRVAGDQAIICGLASGLRKVHNLAYLPASRVVGRQELQAAWAATVPGDDAALVCCFYVCIESVGSGYIHECRRGWGVQRPLLRRVRTRRTPLLGQQADRRRRGA